MSFWANFANTGWVHEKWNKHVFQFYLSRNPSLRKNWTWTDIYWPLHTSVKREILVLSTDLSNDPSSVLEGHRVRQCAFWKELLPQLGKSKIFCNRESPRHLQSMHGCVSCLSLYRPCFFRGRSKPRLCYRGPKLRIDKDLRSGRRRNFCNVTFAKSGS